MSSDSGTAQIPEHAKLNAQKRLNLPISPGFTENTIKLSERISCKLCRLPGGICTEEKSYTPDLSGIETSFILFTSSADRLP